MAATAADETAGRLTLLFSRPVARARWAATEAGVIVTALVVLAAAAGRAVERRRRAGHARRGRTARPGRMRRYAHRDLSG